LSSFWLILKQQWTIKISSPLFSIFSLAWKNDKWYNKRVLIWRFTLVLIKINYGQIGDQKGSFIQQTQYFRQSDRHVCESLVTFDTQACRSSHLRYFRSPLPILLARTVGLVAKFKDCRWSLNTGLWNALWREMKIKVT